MSESVMVSIVCNAYNHEKFIAKALEGFVNQKCNFKFEVLVHDDASTDSTAQIIKQYEARYPEIIKPIYQAENQYSKGLGLITKIQYARVTGKYTAVCEGDDYWIDENKLQIQVDYMESHPDCTICVTNGEIHNLSDGTVTNFVCNLSSIDESTLCDKDLTLPEMINFYVPTASFLYPSKNRSLFPKSFGRYCFGGDKKLVMYCTALGYCHYINKLTCVYDKGVPGSATTIKRSKEYEDKIYKGYINLYNDLNCFTDYVYNEQLSQVVLDLQKSYLLQYPSLYKTSKYYHSVGQMLSTKQRLALIIKNRFKPQESTKVEE